MVTTQFPQAHFTYSQLSLLASLGVESLQKFTQTIQLLAQVNANVECNSWMSESEGSDEDDRMRVAFETRIEALAMGGWGKMAGPALYYALGNSKGLQSDGFRRALLRYFPDANKTSAKDVAAAIFEICRPS